MFCTWAPKSTIPAAALVAVLATVGGCSMPGSSVAAGANRSVQAAAPLPLTPTPSIVVPTAAQVAPNATVPAPRPAVGNPVQTPVAPARTAAPPASSAPRPAATPTAAPTTPAPAAPAGGASPAPAPAPAPAGAPAAYATANPNAFAFTLTNSDGTPVRWNPCAPIHYVTNLAEAPGSAAADVTQALQILSSASGLSFVNDGSTTEVPSSNRPVDQPSRYGSGHSPLLIAWARKSETNIYNGEGANTVGTASNTWIGAMPGAANQESAYVTGQVAIEPDATRSFPSGFGSGRTIGLALLHELGHVAGLAHVSDSNQVMYPDLMSVPVAAYAAGDRNGLKQVGASSGCLPAR